jgi:hypothetical protein
MPCPIEQRPVPAGRYTDLVKAGTVIARETGDAGLERIKELEEQLALVPVNSRQRRTLSAAIRIEADAYRKSLDMEQAAATHDTKTERVGPIARPGMPRRSAPHR